MLKYSVCRDTPRGRPPCHTYCPHMGKFWTVEEARKQPGREHALLQNDCLGRHAVTAKQWFLK